MFPRGRLWLLYGGLAVWALVVWLRLAQVQLLDHGAWAQLASEQQEKTIEVQQPRGEILTRDGRVLAGSLERVRVGANPRRIPRSAWPSLARDLAPLVGLSETDILARFRTASGFLYVAKDLDPSVVAAIKRLGHDHLWTEPTERRVYPHGSLAGATIGFVNGEGVGQAGLEALFESTLSGSPGTYRLVRDGSRKGTQVELRPERPGRPGLTLRLALDSRVQVILERELDRTIEEIGARGAAAVAMDPWTGQVLGLASLPSYNPGRPGDVPAELRRNRTVEDAIEPGSTFKPFIFAAALAHGALRPHELVDCSGGGVQVAGFLIRDHASYGLLSATQALAVSSNSGAIRIAHRLTPAVLDATIRGLGFGSATGIELPAEARGIYRSPEHWSALSRAGLAIGQEISASALQIARGYAALANGGMLVRPTLVLETLDARDHTVITPYRQPKATRALPPEVARQVAAMLGAVVDEGTGKAARVEGYRAAGKTGTAQKAGVGGYTAGLHAAWFAGFLPRENPRFVVVVCVDQPERTYWAADVAAPTFGRIATRLVTALGLPPVTGART